MGSTNKTDKAKLNQYLGSDNLKRDDYNADMSIIDAIIKQNDEPVVPEISGSQLSISTLESLKTITLKITTVVSGAITIKKNDAVAKPLTFPNGDSVDELTNETMFYIIQEEAEAFLYAPKGGALKEFFGDGSDGILNTTGNVTLTSVLNGPAIVKQYTDITINAGDTLTVSDPCQGLILYATGDVVIDGNITMSQKAGLAPNGNVIPMIMTNFKATDPNGIQQYNELTLALLALYGGTGGNGGYGGGSSGASGRSTGGNGGNGRQNNGGFGGGGGGGADYSSVPRAGGKGGDIDYAELGGGKISQVNYVLSSTTVAKVDGINGSGGIGAGPSRTINAGKCNGAGGGGTGGEGSVSGTDGNYSGGFLLIIAKGNITINSGGSIVANGGNGGTGGNAGGGNVGGGGGGGGAGGGVIAIFYKGSHVNTGTITVNGGSGGGPGTGSGSGESGGSGTSGSVGTIKTLQL